MGVLLVVYQGDRERCGWYSWSPFSNKAVQLCVRCGRTICLHPNKFRDYITLRCLESLSSLILKMAFSEVDRASFLGGRDHSGPGLEDQGALSDDNTLARLLGGSG